MKAAIIVPAWELPPSGGRRGLHLISKTLKDMGVEAVTVGAKYPYEEMGDTIVEEFASDEETVLILPESHSDPYYGIILEMPHGPVVNYAQNSGMCFARKPYETHYWGLGERHNKWVRGRMEIPEHIPIEELFLPLDTAWWRPAPPPKPTPAQITPGAFLSCGPSLPDRIPGSIIYYPRRGAPALDVVARRGNVKPVFRVHGASQEEVRQLLAQADIFLLASQTEGQSCAANEAMAMECAVISWTSAGMPDVIDHEENGLLVEQDDVVGLSDCVIRLQQDPEFTRKLGRNARQKAMEMFSLERFKTSLEKAWNRTVA